MSEHPKNPAAVALARLGRGRKKAYTRAQRRALAKRLAAVRWRGGRPRPRQAQDKPHVKALDTGLDTSLAGHQRPLTATSGIPPTVGGT